VQVPAPERAPAGGADVSARSPGRLALAEEALAVAQADPDRALRLASSALAAVEPAEDAEVAVVAEWALGVAAWTREDLVRARGHLVRAVELADASGLTVRAAEARTSLLLVLASLGELPEALRQADLAAGALSGAAAARLAGQRAIVLHRLGRHDEALAGYRRALAGMRRWGDREREARLLSNRGVLHVHRGDYRAATADLLAAERLHVELGRELSAAEVRHNLGFVASRRGDVPEALRWFDLAEAQLRAHGQSGAPGLLDRCETLLAVRLVAEARRVATTAIAELDASGAAMDVAEARLLLAQAALLDDDPAEAAAQAALAHRAFVDQQRPGWAALARYAGLRAAWATAGAPPELQEATAVADELTHAGWAVPALDARLIAARIALDLGRAPEATAQLRAASAARSRGPADLRARAWHAEALLRRTQGDRRGAEAALRAGLRVLARNRATLGATELRVHATAHVADLDRLGTRLALESGEARRVLGWAERVRADFAGGTRAPRPPADREIADRLAELRHVVGQLEQAGFAAEDPARLLRRQAALEAEIRRRSRHAAGERPGAAADGALGQGARRPSVPELAGALGERALVELVASDGALIAVSLVGGRACLHQLGSTAEVLAGVETLRFALARLARAGGAAGRQAAVALLREASAALDRTLFDPVRRRIGDRPLVLVPTAPLHAVPWSALPSCRGRPVVVSPSAAGWWRAETAHGPSGLGRTVLVAGPGLEQAGPEVSDLAGVHQGASCLEGPDATTEAFLAAADGVDLVHVAAHGRFRADNPLLSSLRLADGPLTVYDLERLARVPRRLVLSACDAGLSAARPGDEVMGLAASLLALGSRTLVASVVPVRDTATRPLMVDLHRRLASGAGPAEALARAHATIADDDPETLSAAGFVCFGSG
jgi:tetratricopeptide (TPR) repeat protein